MSITSAVTTIYEDTQLAEQISQAGPDISGMQTLRSPTTQMGQGPAVRISEGSLAAKNNEHGFTHPDLHRTIDPADPQNAEDTIAEADPNELAPRDYSVGIYGVNSYRTTRRVVHTEEEFIRTPGEIAKTPAWNEYLDENQEYMARGNRAVWQPFPAESSPVANGTPDEIP